MRGESVSASGALRYDAIRFRGPSVRMDGKPARSSEKMPEKYHPHRDLMPTKDAEENRQEVWLESSLEMKKKL